MKHNVSELEGALLDAAVAKAEGNVAKLPHGREIVCPYRFEGSFSPSSDWKDGGPIIERERIDLICLNEDAPNLEWGANFQISWVGLGVEAPWKGPTPLIAAMRAYVASKLGEEIDLP